MNWRSLLVIAGLSLCLAAPSCGPKPVPVNPAPVPAAAGAVSTGGNSAVAGEASLAGQAGAAGNATATKCQLACANLSRLGCPEDQSTCVIQCEILTRDARFTFDADCRISATTKAAAQKCGPASCRE